MFSRAHRRSKRNRAACILASAATCHTNILGNPDESSVWTEVLFESLAPLRHPTASPYRGCACRFCAMSSRTLAEAPSARWGSCSLSSGRWPGGWAGETWSSFNIASPAFSGLPYSGTYVPRSRTQRFCHLLRQVIYTFLFWHYPGTALLLPSCERVPLCPSRGPFNRAHSTNILLQYLVRFCMRSKNNVLCISLTALVSTVQASTYGPHHVPIVCEWQSLPQ